MTDKDFEILIRYNSWNVEVFDSKGNSLTRLLIKRKWFSNFHSGVFSIDNKEYLLNNSGKGLRLFNGNADLGQIDISTFNSWGRIASFQIEGKFFNLKRENLKQLFTLTDNSNKIIFKIDGKLYKHKQWSLFGLIYIDDKVYHSVYLSNYTLDKHVLQIILIICGYCIRVFFEIDMGDYPRQMK